MVTAVTYWCNWLRLACLKYCYRREEVLGCPSQYRLRYAEAVGIYGMIWFVKSYSMLYVCLYPHRPIIWPILKTWFYQGPNVSLSCQQGRSDYGGRGRGPENRGQEFTQIIQNPSNNQPHNEGRYEQAAGNRPVRRGWESKPSSTAQVPHFAQWSATPITCMLWKNMILPQVFMTGDQLESESKSLVWPSVTKHPQYLSAAMTWPTLHTKLNFDLDPTLSSPVDALSSLILGLPDWD